MEKARACLDKVDCTDEPSYNVQEVGEMLSRLLFLLETSLRPVHLDNGTVQAKDRLVAPVAATKRMTMDVTEIAHELNVSTQTVRAMIHRKELPAFKVGNKFGVERTAFQMWIMRQSQIKRE